MKRILDIIPRHEQSPATSEADSEPSRSSDIKATDSGKPHRSAAEGNLGKRKRLAKLKHINKPGKSSSSSSSSCSSNGSSVDLHLLFEEANSNKEEEQTAQETSHLELDQKAEHCTAPQTNTNVVEDWLAEIDRDSVSDASDNELRSSTNGLEENKTHEEMELAETLSSASYHPSPITQKLHTTMEQQTLATQKFVEEYQRCLRTASRRQELLANSLNCLKKEKAALKRSEEDLQAEVKNLKFQFKQEQEKSHNATMMYNTIRDKLRRTEEKLVRLQEGQNVGDIVRIFQNDVDRLTTMLAQVQFNHGETLSLLDEEQRAHMTMEEEYKRKLSEASQREMKLDQEKTVLQLQHETLRADNECFLNEVEALKSHGSTIKLKLAEAIAFLKNERQIHRQTAAAEEKSNSARLAEAMKEAELCLAAQREAERALVQEKDEHRHVKERLTAEAARQREAISSLSQKLTDAEASTKSVESEVDRVTLQLKEKELLLNFRQREKDQTGARIKELEWTLQTERQRTTQAQTEAARQREAISSLSQKLTDAEASTKSVESEVDRVTLQLKEKELLLDVQQREKDRAGAQIKELEWTLQTERQRTTQAQTEAARQREAISSLSQKLTDAEASTKSVESEVDRVTLQLKEKELLLDVQQREKDQTGARIKELEWTLQTERQRTTQAQTEAARQREAISIQLKEKELLLDFQQREKGQAGARIKELELTLQAERESTTQAQSECLFLRQMVEEAQNQCIDIHKDLSMLQGKVAKNNKKKREEIDGPGHKQKCRESREKAHTAKSPMMESKASKAPSD